MLPNYDVIVVGGGHAGCEAAAVAASMGSRTLLISMNMFAFAQMSCNPAMGGIAKGQIVREIDALGGLSAIVTDQTMIQFRMLNRSKGPAMWSPRSQNDRILFSIKWREQLENISNLDFWQDNVNGLIVENNKLKGVTTSLGIKIFGKAVILTNGTFLNGIIHIGEKQFSGGRFGDPSSHGLTEQLVQLGFASGRMKTGTPVRIDGRTLNYNKMTIQPGDDVPEKFSFTKTPKLTRQLPCYLVYTSQKVHDVLKTGFGKSPLFKGRIQGIGPRYCPSIEDKIERFSGKSQHQLFVEPEGWNTHEYYLNGFSSSLPEDIQYKALKLIDGFENIKVFRPGYAIEYDFFPPTQLKATLETKVIENLYFAGQINGTTGYEEAAAQGLMAGINAHQKIHEKEVFVLKRSDAYIGVLIDDLITKGVDEPYRMFTSRAEYRILLRQDNADARLTEKGYNLGIINEERYKEYREKQNIIASIIDFINKLAIYPEDVNGYLSKVESSLIQQKTKLSALIVRPQVRLAEIKACLPKFNEFISDLDNYKPEYLENVEIQIKYAAYIIKEQEVAEKLAKYEEIELYESFDYQKLLSLSYEAREKLMKIKPRTIGQASRISGISPADINVLLIYLGK